GAGTDLLDQRRRHAPDGPVSQVPLTGELDHRQSGTVGDRAHRVNTLASRFDPARGSEAAVIAADERLAGTEVVEEQAAIVDDAGDHPDVIAFGRTKHELAGPRL